MQEHGGPAYPNGTQYAIKTYKLETLTPNSEPNVKLPSKSKILKALFSEIKFLRDLNMCENIITLEQVFKSKNSYSLVLKFAEYGCLRDYIINFGSMLEESHIKQIMS